MKAVAVVPGKPHSAHLVDVPMPQLKEDTYRGKGVLVRVLRVGLDGTDREIAEAQYGAAPPGENFLIPGHEGLGMVEQVGPAVTNLAPGDLAVATVRRPGNSVYDAIGLQDFTTDEEIRECGINLLHGFLTQYYLDSEEFLIKVPASLSEVGVLTEPMSVAEKGVNQAYEIQRRLRVWKPTRAGVLGAGAIGLLATLVLRLRGVEVVTLSLDEPPNAKSRLVEALGARYVSTREESLLAASRAYGPFDLIFEATGYSPLAFEAMEALGKNGVLVLSSITGGSRKTEVPSDAINMGFVLGNKVAVGTVNASRDDYNAAVRDLALAEYQYPGWVSSLLTHRVPGLHNFQQAFSYLSAEDRPVKVVVEVAATD